MMVFFFGGPFHKALFPLEGILLGCPKKLGSMVRINGLFHPTYKWGIPWDYNTH